MQVTLKNTIDVKLIDSMGGDHSIYNAARVSTSGESCKDAWDNESDAKRKGLINYLMQHRHGTPFEHACLQFYVHAPIFVWREWHRHRIGMCLAGDTEIWTESITVRSGRTLRKLLISELCDRWNNGTTDYLGRTRRLPSIKSQNFRVLNEETFLVEPGRAESVFESGVKEIFLLETSDDKYNTLKCSIDHPVLTKDGWAKIGDLSGNELIHVSGKRNKHTTKIPPSLRAGIGVWTSMHRNDLIQEIDRCYVCNDPYPREELQLDHIVPVVQDLTKALDKNNLAPVCETCHRRKTNEEQKLTTREVISGSKLVPIMRKPYRIGEEMTYDITMKGRWKNFFANGIVVHNSYNETSGRYKKLEPVFYVPPSRRPMVKISTEKWTAGRPKFTECTNQGVYDQLCENLRKVYQLSYEKYEENLSLDIDPGLARDCLPVGLFSDCWVTLNPRSLMHFLSLRVYSEQAKFLSYPLWEINQAALKLEGYFKELFPLTYECFIANGRVAP